jgi:hypothetical protein
MYGSYGSYSSMSAASAPMDITSSNLRAHDAVCAFPSWPRRSSLSESDYEQKATSYLSDDDLFPQDPFEDDARSVSSAGSIASPTSRSPHLTEAELLEMERERLAMQRNVMQFLLSEKERRRQQLKRQRHANSGSKKSPKSKLSAMTPIEEAAE